MTIKKFYFRSLAGFCLLIASLLAIADTGPVATLESALYQVTDDISSNSTNYERDKESYYQFIEKHIIPLMDVDLFSRAVLGKHGRVASEQQLADFKSAFKDFLIASYADALLQYRGEKVEFKSAAVKEGKRTTATVPSVIHSPEQDYQVSYKMILGSDDQWRIYDVVFEDLSLGINFRNSYGDIIERRGLDHLITLLQDRSAPAPKTL